MKKSSISLLIALFAMTACSTSGNGGGTDTTSSFTPLSRALSGKWISGYMGTANASSSTAVYTDPFVYVSFLASGNDASTYWYSILNSEDTALLTGSTWGNVYLAKLLDNTATFICVEAYTNATDTKTNVLLSFTTNSETWYFGNFDGVEDYDTSTNIIASITNKKYEITTESTSTTYESNTTSLYKILDNATTSGVTDSTLYYLWYSEKTTTSTGTTDTSS